ncbi:hypothetical protein [Parasphaerochaeta coccoides]|uniref:Lipoprotein n=1 Tax=Parasphaerochaeta coccoides (strain ATCC BAA-1237 / DSM 17374 / SPN1) TaxID=760011 RepID=F4GM20_PARC1|nr:hypothetical protein [Parasphaerochaeta coccoides]AEC02495.1 hypothetical protein Spico_1287 [Parasphaerochaeta coccoides DSM 17374]
MRKILFPVMAVLALAMSCASYTAHEGFSRIQKYNPVHPTNLVTTRLADILTQEPDIAAIEGEDSIVSSPDSSIPVDVPIAMMPPVTMNFSVPDLSRENLPYYHQTGASPKTIETPLTRFTVIFIPLPETMPTEEIPMVVSSVADSISDLDADIIILSGQPEASALFAEAIGKSAVIAPEGAVITSFSMTSITDHGVTLTLAPDKDIELRWKTLSDNGVLRSIASGSLSWQQTVVDDAQQRLEQIEAILADVNETAPVIFALSAYEPSHIDWTPLSPRPWRKDMAWPLSTTMEEKEWFDAYAMTHYSGETNSGATWSLGSGNPIEERIDFLYVKNMMSVETSVLHPGVLSAQPSESDKPARMGVLGTFLLP